MLEYFGGKLMLSFSRFFALFWLGPAALLFLAYLAYIVFKVIQELKKRK